MAKEFYQAMINEINNEIKQLNLRKRAYELAIKELEGSTKSGSKAGQPHAPAQGQGKKTEYKYKCDECGELKVTEAIKEFCQKKYRGRLLCYKCQKKLG